MTGADSEPSSGRKSETLDPNDFDAFRRDAHKLLDACVDHLQGARERPWQPVDMVAKAALMPSLPEKGLGESELADILANSVLPYGTGNTHPRFFGWVHGTGLTAGLLAEMTAATMNSNCGGRDHGAVYVERAVIEWVRNIFGFPEGASGILTTGTSQATIIALAVARVRAIGCDLRTNGLRNAPDLVAYCAEGAHSANQKALELMGHGSEALRYIPTTDPTGGMDLGKLSERLAEDRKAKKTPFCIIATAGSVDTGAFDDLEALAELCAAEGLWLHVDGAFGSWARIAEAPWCNLARGIERADSLAFDFHKWMYVQYDCGAVLIRDGDVHRATFSMRPACLAAQESGLGGGEPWYCDYGLDLSRGFRALKIWSSLLAYGVPRISERITKNCEQAKLMGALVQESGDLELAAPVILNICCFRYAPKGVSAEIQNTLNERIAQRVQLEGNAVFSTTHINGKTVLRAAIVNHRTLDEDIEFAISAVREACALEFSRFRDEPSG